jgi:hypothetical protein
MNINNRYWKTSPDSNDFFEGVIVIHKQYPNDIFLKRFDNIYGSGPKHEWLLDPIMFREGITTNLVLDYKIVQKRKYLRNEQVVFVNRRTKTVTDFSPYSNKRVIKKLLKMPSADLITGSYRLEHNSEIKVKALFDIHNYYVSFRDYYRHNSLLVASKKDIGVPVIIDKSVIILPELNKGDFVELTQNAKEFYKEINSGEVIYIEDNYVTIKGIKITKTLHKSMVNKIDKFEGV